MRQKEGMKCMIKKCDMCGSKINDGKCDWTDAEANINNSMKLELKMYNDMKHSTLTVNSPYLSCAVVYFRGDYNDYKREGNPFYWTHWMELPEYPQEPLKWQRSSGQ